MAKLRKQCSAPECTNQGQSLGKKGFSSRCKKHRKGPQQYHDPFAAPTLTPKKKRTKQPDALVGSKTFRQGINSLKDNSPQFFRP